MPKAEDAKREQAELTERVRMLLFGEPSLREVSMFGGRSFMVNNKMVAHAHKGGALLARVDPDRHHELVEQPGASQAYMGPDREMGPGWIEVAAGAVATDDQLSAWLDVALQHNRTIAAKSR